MKNFLRNKWVKYVIFVVSVCTALALSGWWVALPLLVVYNMYWSEISLPKGSFRVTFSGYSDEELAEIKRRVEEKK